jgi:hypothetical protein
MGALSAHLGISPLLLVATGLVPARIQEPPSGHAAPAGPDARGAEDAAAKAAFERLSPAERKDLIDYFRSEAEHVRSFQAGIVSFVLGEQDRDPKAWPEEQPLPFFDSKEHTPENDIPRHRLEADAAPVKALAAKLSEKAPKPRFESAWRYDYGSRGLVRSKAWKDPERIFENGLAGAPPDLDLVEALVERALDDGAEQKALGAFGHAYTDRDGGVYPGITLFDAWGSGTEIETPDVDTLGIVHTVLGDWKTWKAPVPAVQHEKLFDKIGEVFLGAQRHRDLRHALAQTYAQGSAALGGGYEGFLDNFHALWEDAKSTPADLLPQLPASAKRSEFLAAWTERCHKDPDLWVTAVRRHRTLDAEGAAVRELLLRLLDEFSPKAGAAKESGSKAPPKDH